MSEDNSQDLVLYEKKIKAAEKALAELIIHKQSYEKSYGTKSGDKFFKEKMHKAFKLFDRLTSGLGITEYNQGPDGNYTGDQTFEKYKDAVNTSWGGGTEAKDAVKAITNSEISSGADDYEERRKKVNANRALMIENTKKAQQLYLEQEKSRKLLKNAPESDDEDEEADDVVDRALGQKKTSSKSSVNSNIKAKKTVASIGYVPLFAKGKGAQVERNVNAIAMRNETDIDDYHGFQQDILAGSDDEELTREQMQARIDNAGSATHTRNSRMPTNHLVLERSSSEEESDDDEGAHITRNMRGSQRPSAGPSARRPREL